MLQTVIARSVHLSYYSGLGNNYRTPRTIGSITRSKIMHLARRKFFNCCKGTVQSMCFRVVGKSGISWIDNLLQHTNQMQVSRGPKEIWLDLCEICSSATVNLVLRQGHGSVTSCHLHYTYGYTIRIQMINSIKHQKKHIETRE